MTNKTTAAFIALALALMMAAPALAQSGNNTTATTVPNATVNATCVKAALEKREPALISAVESYSAAVTAALEKRMTDLGATWDISDVKSRRSAIKKAWSAYKTSLRGARQELKAEKRAAWSQYLTDIKPCAAILVDPTGASVDNSI